MTTYCIVRNYFNHPGRRSVIRSGLTLDEAQAHCGDPETSSRTCTTDEGRARTEREGPWFDGYEAEDFCRARRPSMHRALESVYRRPQ